jgi:hypothetical protein
MADEAVRLGGRVEHGRQLVHERDHADGEPGEVPLAALGVAEKVLLSQQDREEDDQDQVEEDDEGGHGARKNVACVTALTVEMHAVRM